MVASIVVGQHMVPSLWQGGELDRPAAEQLADLFTVIAEPARLILLNRLAGADDFTVTGRDLIATLQLSQPTVSHHMRVLQAVGLVERRKVGVFAYYRLESDAFVALCQALTPPSRSRAKSRG